MDQNKPEPCPLCGSEARLETHEAVDAPYMESWVVCSSCGLRSEACRGNTRRAPKYLDDGSDIPKALAAWARRTTPRERALQDALEEVMSWISNWDPNFSYDEEWTDTKARVEAALLLGK